ncbi:MAG TPA: alpha-mannosidase, partial [Clostridia bacterium]|nr:alpha-mannosidase [Clostridia bacterium]
MPYHIQFMESEIKKVREIINEKIYTVLEPLDAVMYKTREPLPFERRTEGEKSVVKVGEVWGENWDCAWFNFTGYVPESAAGKYVVLMIDVNGELCVFDDSGCPVEGLTSVEQYYPDWLGSPGKHIYPISEHGIPGEKIDIWADCASNDLFGGYIGDGKLKEAFIAVCNKPLRDLSYDFEVLYELYELIPKEKARKAAILHAMYNAAVTLTDYTEDEALYARSVLKPELDKKGGDPSLEITAIGHAHLDLAWAWPIRETIRKGARTFSTAIANMGRYPDYVFGASQPQLYEWMKKYYPALYEKVKEKVRGGRWEPQGAMWVEADTNLTSGESLVRQILYGKRFFFEEFGQEMKVLWMPDVFGYTGALPQIMKKSGVDYFMTTKILGNRYNKMPHHTFIWKGIDGTGVLAHMPPEGYNSSAAPHAILKMEEDYTDKGVAHEALLLFGIGDGGGGPGEAHLER